MSMSGQIESLIHVDEEDMTVDEAASRMLAQRRVYSDLTTCILQFVRMEEYEQYPSLKIVDERVPIHHPSYPD